MQIAARPAAGEEGRNPSAAPPQRRSKMGGTLLFYMEKPASAIDCRGEKRKFLRGNSLPFWRIDWPMPPSRRGEGGMGFGDCESLHDCSG